MSEISLTKDFVKDLYDTQVPKKYRQYEFDRWFADSASWVDYVMTHRAVMQHIKGVNFSNVLELGPGPGTWTKLLFRHNNQAHFDLIDISEAMHDEFEREMRGGHNNVNYILHDFVTYPIKGVYDLFFSSRAIEYFSDKHNVLRKVYKHLVSGGKGIIITKNRGFSRDERLQHSAQCTPQELESLIRSEGFMVEGVFPCVVRLPLLGRISSRLVFFVFKRLFTRPFKQRYSRIIESFVIVFSKP